MENTTVDVFKFQDMADVRVIMIGGEPWFVASDVCRVLGLTHVTTALSRVNEADCSTTTVSSGGQGRHVKIINESGLYDLIMDSRKPEAKAFRRWITSEVVPTIRKTGGVYVAPDSQAAQELLDDPIAAVERALKVAKEERARRLELEHENGQLTKENEELGTEAVISVAIEEKNDGYCRRDVYAVAKKEFSLKCSAVEFNKLLHKIGITSPRPEGSSGFNINPDYYHLSNDPTYYNWQVGSTMPNSNPHFTKEGMYKILEILADYLYPNDSHPKELRIKLYIRESVL